MNYKQYIRYIEHFATPHATISIPYRQISNTLLLKLFCFSLLFSIYGVSCEEGIGLLYKHSSVFTTHSLLLKAVATIHTCWIDHRDISCDFKNPSLPDSIEWFIEDQDFSRSAPPPTPFPLPPAGCLSFLVFLCVAGWAFWRETMGEDQNHTTARKIFFAISRIGSPPLSLAFLLSLWQVDTWPKFASRGGWMVATGPMFFDFCRLYPFRPQPPQWCLALTCHLSTLN